MTILTFLGLYLFSAGSSWALFSFLKSDPGAVTRNPDGGKVGEGLPKTEECPINGQMYSEPEREIWEQRRPITAVIENHLDSRPQSGLSNADVVYEAVAEGGITRFLSVFYCGVSAADVRIAPIRSVRVYFVHWAAEYGENPIFVHIGGANNICNNCPGGVKEAGQTAREADAFRLLSSIGWRYARGNSFDGGTNIGYPVIIRDQYRLGSKSEWEHSVVGFTDKIYEEAESRGFSAKNTNGDYWWDEFTKWKFADEKPADTPAAENISFKFWNGKPEYDVSFEYNQSDNTYLRFNGGQPHKDLETDTQIAVKNVVVMFTQEKGPVDKEGHLLYTTEDRGNAIVFQNGNVIEGTWEKKTMNGKTLFYDGSGKEIDFVRGMIWIAAVPRGNTVSY